MAESSSGWTLENFQLELDLWLEREAEVHDEIALLVLAWIQGRMDEPYSGAMRAPDLDNWWYAKIPATYSSTGGRVVVCTFQIFEQTRVVRCRSYALLSEPL